MQYELIAFVLGQHYYRLIFCALGNVGVGAESHSRDNNIMRNTIFEYYNSKQKLHITFKSTTPYWVKFRSLLLGAILIGVSEDLENKLVTNKYVGFPSNKLYLPL